MRTQKANAANHLFVVAAGNSRRNCDQGGCFPCAYVVENIICVAASDRSDDMASFSNYGPLITYES